MPSVSNVIFDRALLDAPSPPERPLGMSLLASTLLHVALIALLASAAHKLSLIPAWQGAAGPIQVDLQRAAAPAPEKPPEVIAATVPSPSKAAPPRDEPRMKVPVTTSSSASATASPPLSVRTGPPNPDGSVAVGLLATPEQVSRAVAARLAQSFPVAAARAPRLNGAVITAYPVDAARARQSARIAAVLTIDASGKIVDRETVIAPDDPVFRSAVLTALATTQFTPAELDGKPIAYWAILEFVFDIDPLPGTTAGRR